jgi:hypothetical protein
VACEPAYRARFIVRFPIPIPLVGGNALESLARILHLLIELAEHHLADCHNGSLSFVGKQYGRRTMAQPQSRTSIPAGRGRSKTVARGQDMELTKAGQR